MQTHRPSPRVRVRARHRFLGVSVLNCGEKAEVAGLVWPPGPKAFLQPNGPARLMCPEQICFVDHLGTNPLSELGWSNLLDRFCRRSAWKFVDVAPRQIQRVGPTDVRLVWNTVYAEKNWYVLVRACSCPYAVGGPRAVRAARCPRRVVGVLSAPLCCTTKKSSQCQTD